MFKDSHKLDQITYYRTKVYRLRRNKTIFLYPEETGIESLGPYLEQIRHDNVMVATQ